MNWLAVICTGTNGWRTCKQPRVLPALALYLGSNPFEQGLHVTGLCNRALLGLCGVALALNLGSSHQCRCKELHVPVLRGDILACYELRPWSRVYLWDITCMLGDKYHMYKVKHMGYYMYGHWAASWQGLGPESGHESLMLGRMSGVDLCNGTSVGTLVRVWSWTCVQSLNLGSRYQHMVDCALQAQLYVFCGPLGIGVIWHRYTDIPEFDSGVLGIMYVRRLGTCVRIGYQILSRQKCMSPVHWLLGSGVQNNSCYILCAWFRVRFNIYVATNNQLKQFSVGSINITYGMDGWCIPTVHWIDRVVNLVGCLTNQILYTVGYCTKCGAISFFTPQGVLVESMILRVAIESVGSYYNELGAISFFNTRLVILNRLLINSFKCQGHSEMALSKYECPHGWADLWMIKAGICFNLLCSGTVCVTGPSRRGLPYLALVLSPSSALGAGYPQ
ncbi:uncharacterized protein MELLADRAFT_109171 [Melampsora larici-populina 98AG31]|uniref:Uncharacterized protein n=1 Tax=Melampsora larici-populina (strain 98AG31 / pathotype 3-4-7) TaxID=747676 RepID=F4RVJ9_MELLP|nr:uncharacterized protein MELLADRAFT_109171 [Melampsora larici-populina 98AG31]EGG03634.1 hypothetical protein MELLADRAFT_109171 [Melampsora larici-populina 98AG31]